MLVDRPWRVVLLRYATIIARRELSYLVSHCASFFSIDFYSLKPFPFFAFVDRKVRAWSPPPPSPLCAKRQFDAFTRNLSRYETRCHYRLAECRGNNEKNRNVFAKETRSDVAWSFIYSRFVVRFDEWRNVHWWEKKRFIADETKGNGTFFRNKRRFLIRAFSVSVNIERWNV